MLLFLLVLMAGYVFWPRLPSLEAFRPPGIAMIECDAVENAQARRPVALFVSLYRLYQEEFRLPPLAAAEASWNASQAMRLFLDAADNPDRERALPFLEKTFEILRRATHARFDPVVVARLQLHRWTLATDGRSQSRLPTVISEILAMLYGGSASEYSVAATAFAKSDRLLATGRTDAARQASASAWRRLAECLKARSQDKS